MDNLYHSNRMRMRFQYVITPEMKWSWTWIYKSPSLIFYETQRNLKLLNFPNIYLLECNSCLVAVRCGASSGFTGSDIRRATTVRLSMKCACVSWVVTAACSPCPACLDSWSAEPSLFTSSATESDLVPKALPRFETVQTKMFHGQHWL